MVEIKNCFGNLIDLSKIKLYMLFRFIISSKNVFIRFYHSIDSIYKNYELNDKRFVNNK